MAAVSSWCKDPLQNQLSFIFTGTILLEWAEKKFDPMMHISCHFLKKFSQAVMCPFDQIYPLYLLLKMNLEPSSIPFFCNFLQPYIISGWDHLFFHDHY